MKKLLSDLAALPLQGKYLLGSLLSISLVLFFYSFTQVDLNLTLTPSLYPLSFQSFFKNIGYFERPFSTGIFVSIVLLLSLCYLMAIYTKKKLFDRKSFWLCLLVVTIVLTLAYNAFSYDLFNYIFDARIITLYHQNPYVHKALDFPLDPMVHFMRWVHRVYPYGPFWLVLTVPLSYLGFQNFFLTQLLFKALMALSFLGTVYVIGKTQDELHPNVSLLSMVFFALNPLVLIESLVSAHNDIVMLFFAIVSLYFLSKKKNWLSYLFLFISIGIKFATVFLLPLYIYVYYLRKQQKEIHWEHIFIWAVGLMGCAVIAVTLRTNFQPWYLLYILPFTALVPQKPYITIPTITLSLFALLQYVPFLFLGNWDSPVPQILMQVTLSSVMIASILTLLWYIRIGRKRYAKN